MGHVMVQTLTGQLYTWGYPGTYQQAQARMKAQTDFEDELAAQAAKEAEEKVAEDARRRAAADARAKARLEAGDGDDVAIADAGGEESDEEDEDGAHADDAHG